MVLVVYAIGFAFASAAAGISEALPLWLSLLIVAGVILLLAALAGFWPFVSPRRPHLPSPHKRSRRRSALLRRFGAMSERTVEEIEQEIDAERQRLNEDLKALRTEARSLAVVVGAGLVVVALVTWRKGSRESITAVWRLAR